tara:strand:- start:421 stop:1695 length:1275 start_codon:yes stop_codon:yes gene_type:complete
MAFDANNKTPSSARLTIERARYNARIILESGEVIVPTWETKKIKDFLSDEKMFYGRIDEANNSVFPNVQMLKQVGPKDRQIFAHNFVADAFTGLEEDIQSFLRSGFIRQGESVFAPLVCEKGYVDPIPRHFSKINDLAEHFVSSFLSDKMMQISDFETFIPLFRQYVLANGSENPITRSSYIISRDLSVLSSGLAIEVYSGDYSDDAIKRDLFYTNKNFAPFRNAAYQHGFMIDKHIPWRLIADLNSPNMKPYVSKYYTGTPSFSVFQVGSNRADESDIETLIQIAVLFYNTLAFRFPVSQTSKCSEPVTISRSTTTTDDVRASTPSTTWLSLYAELRNVEIGIDYDENQMASIMENATDLLNKVDIGTATGYISNKFNSVEHFGGSLFHDIISREAAKAPDADQTDIATFVKGKVQASNFTTY